MFSIKKTNTQPPSSSLAASMNRSMPSAELRSAMTLDKYEYSREQSRSRLNVGSLKILSIKH